MTLIRVEQLRVGQVLAEDDHFITLKIGKSHEDEYVLVDGNEFVTLLFAQVIDGRLDFRFPWST